VTSPWREVGDRVWVCRYESLDQTIGVVGGERGLVVVDTRATHLAADELRSELRQLPGLVHAVVNTHGHWDHVFGNARFLPSPIWGHARCPAMIVERGEEWRARLLREYPGEPFDEVELTPPSQVFEDSATLDASVLFAGDLLENAPTPGFGDSYPIAWVETGRRLLELVDGVVVPGHGDPFDRAFAARQVAELATVAELGRQAASGAIGLDEAIRRSPFPAEPSAEALERARLELTE
jgi:glyoxylase-like metal-dependent hydrolase (beta-lactamase superfamily II)